MKKTNLELIVGGIIFIALFTLLTGVLWLKQVSITRKVVKYTMVFSNVGTLQKGDPVTVNGVRGGSVSKIYLKGASVAVEVNLDKNIKFTDSSTVAIQNIGLMGERMVHIKLSEKGTLHIPDKKDSISLIGGTFDSGIAEAMGALGNVLTDVTTLIDTVQEIIYLTIGNQNFLDFFDSFVERLDTVIYLVDELVEKNKTDVDITVKNLRNATDALKSIVNNNRNTIDKIVENGEVLTDKALVIADKVDSISTSVNRIIADIEAGKGTVGVLLEDDAVINSVKFTVESLDSLIESIDDEGLKLRLKLFGNRKYFRETKKAKEAAEASGE